MPQSKFAVCQILLGFNNEKPYKPYRILETYPTINGTRTRIVDEFFETEQEAFNFLADFWRSVGVE